MGKKRSSRDETFLVETAAILDQAYERAVTRDDTPYINDPSIQNHIHILTRNNQNRACVRVLLSSLLAKIDDPDVDIRKPYTKIGDNDTYSGRGYDEHYVTQFIHTHNLPCNTTTGYLTPAFRNLDQILTRDMGFIGRPVTMHTKNFCWLSQIVPSTNLSKKRSWQCDTPPKVTYNLNSSPLKDEPVQFTQIQK